MFRRLLGLDRMEDRLDELEDHVQDLEEIRDRQEVLENELESLRDETVSGSELDQRLEVVRQELEDLSGRVEDAASDQDEAAEAEQLSPNEKRVLGCFVRNDGYLSVQDIADKIEPSKGSVRKYLSMLKDKIDFDVRQEGRKKTYRLPEDRKKEILEEGRLRSRTG